MNPLSVVWLRWLGLLALEAAIIVGVAWQLQQWTKSALWRRAIGHVSLLSLLLLVVFEFTGTARNLSGWVGKLDFVRVESAASGVGTYVVAASPGLFKLTEKKSTSGLDNIAAPGDGRTPAPVVVENNLPANNILPPPAMLKSARSEPSIESLLFLAGAMLWLLGASVVMGRVLCGRIALEIFRARRQYVTTPETCGAVRDLALRLGLRREVRLIESEHICGPVAFGILRPTIGLPIEFSTKFGAAEKEAMLAHELAHLAGNDPAWYLLADLLAAVLWWHPLIWWARHCLHMDSELAADEASLLVADGPRVLAECLVEIGGRLTQRGAFRGLGVGGNGFRSGLGRRVERLVTLEGGHWRPLNHLRGGLVRALGPLLLVGATILCTAWVFPPAINKGVSMNIIKQTWKKSFTTLALLASVGADVNLQPALAQPPNPPPAPSATQPAIIDPATGMPLPQGGQKSQGAIDPVTGMPAVPPAMKEAQAEMARVQAEIAKQNQEIMRQSADIQKQANAAASAAAVDQYQHAKDLMQLVQTPAPPVRSYGGPVPSFRRDLNRITQADTPEQEAVRAKLGKIMVDALNYDNVPLNEVVRNLIDIATARDPDQEKVGINFVLNRESAHSPEPVGVDPTTGLPIAQPQENFDLGTITVNLEPPLKHVRLIDVLDVITKVADKPITYTITDYGVVFSLAAEKQPTARSGGFSGGGGLGGGGSSSATQAEQLAVTTFKMDTNNFYAGLDRMFGIKLKTNSSGQPQDTQEALKGLMQRVGVNMNEPTKTIFYNDVTGILMVRCAVADIDVVQAVFKTLGGSEYTGNNNGATGFAPRIPGQVRF